MPVNNALNLIGNPGQVAASQADGTLKMQNFAPISQSPASRALNTIFQISTTRWSCVTYTVEITTVSNLLGGQTGRVILEISPSSTFASSIQEVGSGPNGNLVSLAIAVTATQLNAACISGWIPAGFYCRLRTENILGTPTYSYRSGQEVLL